MSRVVSPPSRLRDSAYRLRGERAFEALFRRGTRFDGRFLQLIAAPAQAAPGRVGYIIARRSIPLAVDRNRLRRRLREVVRGARPAASAYDMILRLRGPLLRKDLRAAADEAVGLVARLTGGAA